jgi:hypothetical protein
VKIFVCRLVAPKLNTSTTKPRREEMTKRKTADSNAKKDDAVKKQKDVHQASHDDGDDHLHLVKSEDPEHPVSCYNKIWG